MNHGHDELEDSLDKYSFLSEFSPSYVNIQFLFLYLSFKKRNLVQEIVWLILIPFSEQHQYFKWRTFWFFPITNTHLWFQFLSSKLEHFRFHDLFIADLTAS